MIDCLAKVDDPDIEGVSDWLNVCTEIKENLQAVDDATPERYPNRMIADLSDMLEDTSAIAIVWASTWYGAISHLRTMKDRNFFSPAVCAMG